MSVTPRQKRMLYRHAFRELEKVRVSHRISDTMLDHAQWALTSDGQCRGFTWSVYHEASGHYGGPYAGANETRDTEVPDTS